MQVNDIDEAIKASKADTVWAWLCGLNPAQMDYVLQDLPRWMKEHRRGPQEQRDAFLFHWSKRQEFRSVLRYRAKQAVIRFGIKENYLDKVGAGVNWMFVQNLYLSCDEIGPGLYIEHGFSTVVYAHSIGENFRVNQNVTVGTSHGDKPRIKNNCSIYTAAVVVGGITIEDNVRIGAGAIVTENIPANCTVVPQKPRIICRDQPTVLVKK